MGEGMDMPENELYDDEDLERYGQTTKPQPNPDAADIAAVRAAVFALAKHAPSCPYLPSGGAKVCNCGWHKAQEAMIRLEKKYGAK